MVNCVDFGFAVNPPSAQKGPLAGDGVDSVERLRRSSLAEPAAAGISLNDDDRGDNDGTDGVEGILKLHTKACVFESPSGVLDVLSLKVMTGKHLL